MQVEEGTGLYDFRNRLLDPETGRFLSRDPLGIWGDGINLGNPYTAFGSDPINRRDPMGLQGAEAAGPETAGAGGWTPDWWIEGVMGPKPSGPFVEEHWEDLDWARARYRRTGNDRYMHWYRVHAMGWDPDEWLQHGDQLAEAGVEAARWAPYSGEAIDATEALTGREVTAHGLGRELSTAERLITVGGFFVPFVSAKVLRGAARVIWRNRRFLAWIFSRRFLRLGPENIEEITSRVGQELGTSRLPEPDLPEGMTSNSQFGKAMGWGSGLEAARDRAGNAQRQLHFPASDNYTSPR